MRKTMSYLLFLFFIALCFSCSDSDSDSAKTATIKGKVLFYKDNSPIVGAVVSTYPVSQSAMTNSAGEFTISGVEKDSIYTVIANKYPYLANSAQVNTASGSISNVVILLGDSTNSSVDTSGHSQVDADLVLYLPFDNSLTDAGIYKMSVYGDAMTFVSDRKGAANSAVYFDGSRMFYVPSSTNLDLTGDYTLSVWVKPSTGYGYASQAGWINLFGRWKGVGTYLSSYVMQINTDYRAPTCANNDGSTNYICYSTSTLAENAWTHLACVFSGHILKLYVNGVLSSQISANNAESSYYNLVFGMQDDGACAYRGAMDEARIYSRALSAGEIANLAK